LYTNSMRRRLGGTKPTVADIVVHLRCISARSTNKADKERRKAQVSSPIPIGLTPDSGGSTTIASLGAVGKVSLVEW